MYPGFLHVRSFSSSSSATTALWVNQELADHGSDSISSVLKLKRVEPNEFSKTPEGRRELKKMAARSVEVEGLGRMITEYTELSDKEPSGCPVPEFVHCQQSCLPNSHEPPQNSCMIEEISCEVAPLTSSKNKDDFITCNNNVAVADQFIDQAAGLLLLLSHAPA